MNSIENHGGFYTERSGNQAADLVVELEAEPTRPLSDTEKEAVYVFEHRLAAEEYIGGVTIEQALLGVKDALTLDPQIDPQDIEMLRQLKVNLGKSGKAEQEIVEEMRAATTESRARLISRIAKGLTTRSRPDESFESVNYVVRPDALLTQMSQITALRSTLLERRKSLSEGGEVTQAERAVVEVYLALCNESMAKTIPMMVSLAEQARAEGDSQLMVSAKSLLPRYFNDPTAKESVFTRLDYLRNGASQVDFGDVQGISSIDNSYFERLDPDYFDSTKQVNLRRGMFTPEQIGRLKEKMVSSDECARIIKDALSDHDLLSAEPEADIAALDRTGRAADGKFQILIGSKGSFAVDGKRGLFKVPAAPVSLFTLLTTVGAHEFEHVNQAQADLNFAQTMKIGRIKGKGVSPIREAGANRKERAFQQELSGEQKPFALTYAKALQALENGGDLYDMAEAFYLEKLRISPTMDKGKAAREAADRVLRLLNYGKNSQSMAYVEEEILQNELVRLPEDMRSRATLITCLSLTDQARLHQFGLLPTSGTDSIDWSHDILQRVMPYIDATLAAGS